LKIHHQSYIRRNGPPTLHRMALFMNPAQMAVDAKSVTTPTCTATTLHRMTGLSLSTLHRMALFVNPAQMVVDAKSVTTPTCTAATLN
jgi:hypothetical protein